MGVIVHWPVLIEYLTKEPTNEPSPQYTIQIYYSIQVWFLRAAQIRIYYKLLVITYYI